MITITELSRILAISDRTLSLFIEERYSKLGIGNLKNFNKKSSLFFPEESLPRIYTEIKIFFQKHSELAEEAIVWYWRIANQGDKGSKMMLEQADSSALYFLGDCLWYGYENVPQNKAEAVVCYWKAANRGDELAKVKLKKTETQYILGECFFHGRGVLRDAAEAVAWYRKAAENGNVEAQRVLGDCFFNGKGVLEKKEEAKYWYQKAAENGDLESQKILDEYFFYEEEISEKKEKEVVLGLWKAMKQGDKISQDVLEKSPSSSLRLLGDFLWSGEENVHQNKEEAVAWYWKAANRGDELAKVKLKKTEVLCLLANCFWDEKGGLPKNKILALFLYWEAMKGGSEKAKEFFEHHVSPAFQRSLADRLLNGTDGVSQNSREAVICYRKAAENGDVKAMRLLGDCLFEGIGSSKNSEEAVVWYRKAAENGDVKAMRLLGDCLFEGIGTFQNREEAVIWYWKAARRRDEFAEIKLSIPEVQRFLGACFFDGNGVPKNRIEGVGWYRKAASRGDAAAMRFLAGLSQDKTEAAFWERRLYEEIDRSFASYDCNESDSSSNGYDVGTR